MSCLCLLHEQVPFACWLAIPSASHRGAKVGNPWKCSGKCSRGSQGDWGCSRECSRECSSSERPTGRALSGALLGAPQSPWALSGAPPGAPRFLGAPSGALPRALSWISFKRILTGFYLLGPARVRPAPSKTHVFKGFLPDFSRILAGFQRRRRRSPNDTQMSAETSGPEEPPFCPVLSLPRRQALSLQPFPLHKDRRTEKLHKLFFFA